MSECLAKPTIQARYPPSDSVLAAIQAMEPARERIYSHQVAHGVDAPLTVDLRLSGTILGSAWASFCLLTFEWHPACYKQGPINVLHQEPTSDDKHYPCPSTWKIRGLFLTVPVGVAALHAHVFSTHQLYHFEAMSDVQAWQRHGQEARHGSR